MLRLVTLVTPQEERKMASPKKKLTKKEMKALNHEKLMKNRKGVQVPGQPTNVIQVNFGTNQEQKKAA